MVPEEGLEPSSLAAHDFESCAYTNSATPAYSKGKRTETIVLHSGVILVYFYLLGQP